MTYWRRRTSAGRKSRMPRAGWVLVGIYFGLGPLVLGLWSLAFQVFAFCPLLTAHCSLFLILPNVVHVIHPKCIKPFHFFLRQRALYPRRNTHYQCTRRYYRAR